MPNAVHELLKPPRFQSNRSYLRLDGLTRFLVNRLQELRETDPKPAILAAGLTRLSKIECLEFTSPRTNAIPDSIRRRAEESLLIRIRQQQYSAVAWLVVGPARAESEIRIHAEHQSRIAIDSHALVRCKRANRIAVGQFNREDADCRWFRES